MQTYELTVRGRSISASPSNRTLVRTSIGVDQIHVLFDSAEWLEFPIEVTFGQGDDKVTQPVVMAAIQGSQDWAAEATATVPWEVVDDNGSIAVTFQGTDSQGRHLITAKGAPLRVTEAGDVVAGGEPSDAPSVSQWQQAYADAMAAVNQAASLVANLQQSLESMVSEAEGAISSAVEEAEQSIGSIQPATAESLGVVRIGEGIDVDQNGVISTSGGSGMTDAQRTDLARLKSLSAAMADATYSGSSVTGSPKVKPSALPVANVTTPGAVIPDGTTIRVDQYGMIHSYSETIEPATTEFVGGVKPDGTTITIDQDGTIHGTSAVQSDWNQNDLSKKDHILNRPFFDAPATKTLIDGATLPERRYAAGEAPVHESYTVPIAGPLEQGTSYTVTMTDAHGLYRGTKAFTCDSTSGSPSIGGALDWHNYNFVITAADEGHAEVILYEHSASGSYDVFGGVTLTVTYESTEPVPIPTRFLPLATVPSAGVVKPDGTTITADPDGTLHGAARSDWNQGDPSANGYIANRPFYETSVHTVLLDAHHIEQFEPSDGEEHPICYVELSEHLEAGKTYTVTMSDEQGLYVGTVEIECVIASAYGKPTISGSLSGNEFEIVDIGQDACIVLYASTQSGDTRTFGGITVTIELFDVEVTQLPHKYVPAASSESVGGIRPDGTSTTTDLDGTLHAASPDWNASQGEAGHIANRPFYEAPVHKVLLDGYHVDGQSFQYGNAPSYVDYGSIPLDEAMEAGKTYVVTISDSHRVYSGTGEFASDDTPLPAIDGTIRKRFVIECEDMLRTSVTLRLYGSYMPSQDTVSFGDIDITLELFETNLVQLPSKFVPVASASSVGGIKPDGTTITVGADGTASAVSGYTLPTATSSRLGGVKVDGTSVTADQDGTIHAASAYTLPDATTTQKGGVIVGDGLDVSDGTISVQAPDWDADDGEDGHILNRPFYESSQWTLIASGEYSSESVADTGGYYQERFRRRASTRNDFDPTLPARLVIDATYDISFSENGANWRAVTSDSTFIVTAQKTGSYWYFSLFSRSYMQDATYAIHSYAPVVTKLPQKYVDYSPCSPAIGATEPASTVVDYAYLLTLNGSKYQRLSVQDLISHAITNYQAILETDSQTVAGAIAELHDDVASLATPEYVDEQTSSLASSIASLARRVVAIERELGISTMSYEDGTLYVSGTYEDGTLVTGAAYQDGTLL